MAEGTHIPGTPACGEWETLLADALDGLLKPEEETRFLAHKAGCPACAALYEAARKGREWLEFLSPEPEPPEGLLERILATTGPGHAVSGLPVPAMVGGVPAFVPPVWQQPGFLARMRSSVQPRLLLTAAMAFFSIALTLNLAGVRLSNLRLADLRPHAMRSYMERQLTMASVPIVRYYDHLRFVYEVESRMRELRGDDESKGGEPQQQQTQPVTPGESRQNPGRSLGSHDGGLRAGPRQQPGSPRTEPASSNEYVETSLKFPTRSKQTSGHTGRQSRGYVVQTLGRSTPWIA
ncbi:MAG: zf-HC2 domain-containing protein [Terracidiphilus sp.]